MTVKVTTRFRLIRLMIGWGISHQFFKQWESKPKSNRTLNPVSFPLFEQVTGNCYDFWLVHRRVCSCCDWFGVITLVLVFRYSFENHSILKNYSFHRSIFLLLWTKNIIICAGYLVYKYRHVILQNSPNINRCYAAGEIGNISRVIYPRHPYYSCTRRAFTRRKNWVRTCGRNGSDRMILAVYTDNNSDEKWGPYPSRKTWYTYTDKNMRIHEQK